MPKGLLQLEGTIDVSQFWPAGRSDADTTKIKVNIAGNAFQFRKDSSSPFQPTHVFDGAVVRGRQTSPTIKNGQVTIRLQGIDATELHYEPSPLSKQEKQGLSAAKSNAYHAVNHFYRQYLGATATKALHDFVSQAGKPTLDARVFTQVDTPNEVFDTYGRMVGDIEVKIGANTINLNHWLVEQGWAFPTFYTSMTNDEISTILDLTKKARTQKAPVWKYLTKTIGPFNFNMVEPKKGELGILATDKGPEFLPKLFRRYTNWSARKKANITQQPFQKYLGVGPDGRPELCFKTPDFLSNGPTSATHYTFDQFVSGGKTINFQPDGLVFHEAPSTLLGPNKKAVTHF